MLQQEEEKLQLLRDLLLVNDREVASAVNEKLEEIASTIETQAKLSEKINPIIEARLKEFVEQMPTSLGPTITQTLKTQIQFSKDEVVEALYPILGKMIKRYIANEIAKLSESINKKVNNTFSMASFKRKIKSKFSGVKESEIMLSELDAAKINEVFAIQKGSGILLGNYSLSSKVDKDMVSGMLTAIKSFVEDAFEGGAQNLESIEYELYSIHIQNFHSYYIAVVISGSYTRAFESDLENSLFKVSEKLSSKINTLSRSEVDSILESLFKSWQSN